MICDTPNFVVVLCTSSHHARALALVRIGAAASTAASTAVAGARIHDAAHFRTRTVVALHEVAGFTSRGIRVIHIVALRMVDDAGYFLTVVFIPLDEITRLAVRRGGPYALAVLINVWGQTCRSALTVHDPLSLRTDADGCVTGYLRAWNGEGEVRRRRKSFDALRPR